VITGAAYNQRLLKEPAMPSLADLIDRVERLLLRHDELKRTNALLQEQVQSLGHERDNLRSRLNAARARIDALLLRLPAAGEPGKTPP
jgi:uncharacterized protein (TIGR02449 family)